MGTMAITWEEVMSEEVSYQELEAKYIKRTGQFMDIKDKLSRIEFKLKETNDLLFIAEQKIKELEGKQNG